ncbi:DUF6913 domain-containing protein [Dysgonomonas sp.]|jgi:hypothetical protein
MFDFLIKRKIDSAFKNNKRRHALKNMKSMHNILIFFSYSDWKAISQIAQDLKQEGKKVVMWTIYPRKRDADSTIFPINVKVIRQDEMSLLNILSSSVVDEFKSLSYDTLIDLTTKQSNVFEYLLAQNTSEFSIGISEPHQKVYDFIIFKKENETLRETYDQIKFYLNNIC